MATLKGARRVSRGHKQGDEENSVPMIAVDVEKLPVFDDAMVNLCNSEQWTLMLEKIQANTTSKLHEKGYERYSELTSLEQAAFVEREINEMQQRSDPVLSSFGTRLSKEVDDELLRMINDLSTTAGVHPSNAEFLSDVCAKSIQAILKTSPPEFATAAKLFLNRSLPTSQRRFIWYSSLDIANIAPDPSAGGRLAPSLDVILTRRVHEVLDSWFPEISSRSAAGQAKTAIANFMRSHGVPLPYSDKSYESTDRLLFILVPVVRALQRERDRELILTYAPDGDVAKIDRNVLDRVMTAMLGPRHLNQLAVTTGGTGLVTKSPCLAYTVSLLNKTDEDVWYHLQQLTTGGGKEEPVLPPITENLEGSEFGSSVSGLESIGGDDGGDAAPVADLLNLSSYRTFESFLNNLLLRGLSGLLPPNTLSYVWDQCFITSFNTMLPVMLTALVMGAAEEMTRLRQVKSAIDSFMTYCKTIDEHGLQLLASQHCKSELMNMFDIEGNYVLGMNQDGVLQAIYRRLMPAGDFVDPEEEKKKKEEEELRLKEEEERLERKAAKEKSKLDKQERKSRRASMREGRRMSQMVAMHKKKEAPAMSEVSELSDDGSNQGDAPKKPSEISAGLEGGGTVDDDDSDGSKDSMTPVQKRMKKLTTFGRIMGSFRAKNKAKAIEEDPDEDEGAWTSAGDAIKKPDAGRRSSIANFFAMSPRTQKTVVDKSDGMEGAPLNTPRKEHFGELMEDEFDEMSPRTQKVSMDAVEGVEAPVTEERKEQFVQSLHDWQGPPPTAAETPLNKSSSQTSIGSNGGQGQEQGPSHVGAARPWPDTVMPQANAGEPSPSAPTNAPPNNPASTLSEGLQAGQGDLNRKSIDKFADLLAEAKSAEKLLESASGTLVEAKSHEKVLLEDVNKSNEKLETIPDHAVEPAEKLETGVDQVKSTEKLETGVDQVKSTDKLVTADQEKELAELKSLLEEN